MRILIPIMQLIIMPVIIAVMSGCSSNATGNEAKIIATPDNVNLVIDTSTVNSSRPTQVITLTNTGAEPAIDIKFEDPKDESAPISQEDTCGSSLASGAQCTLTLKLHTDHKKSSSGVIGGKTTMNYEYNNGQSKQRNFIKINYKIEKWSGTVFLTAQSTSGDISYPTPYGFANILKGTNSADTYCETDKNNPRNGYYYRALIYDSSSRTTSLHWPIYSKEEYRSALLKVYHQLVFKSADNQALDLNLIPYVYNCISTNCINNPRQRDSAAWVGINVNNIALPAKACGMAGNMWRLSSQDLSGISSYISTTGKKLNFTSNPTSCSSSKKIICVSI